MGAMSTMRRFSGVGAGAARSAQLGLRNSPFASVPSKLTSEFIQGLQYEHKTQLSDFLIIYGVC